MDLPELPNWHALGVMALTVVALFLFTRERIPIETTSIVVLAIIAVAFQVFPFEDPEGEKLEAEQFFLGFGNEALIAISALMMASYGLVRTGALLPIGRWTAALWNVSPNLAMFGMLASTAIISAFMNNTPQVVMMIPILVSVGMRVGTPPSKTLMPMTYSAQLGGILTPIGTSLNLLVISTAAGLGVPRFHMFDFFVPGLIIASIGVAYLWLVAPRLLPDRNPEYMEHTPRVFSAVFHIVPNTFADGKSVAEVLQKAAGMKIARIERGEGLTLSKLPVSTLRAGDRIYVNDTPEKLKEYEEILGATLYDGEGKEPITEEHPLAPPKQQLAQIVVNDSSPLVRRTLEQAGFTYRYDLLPLAIHRSRRYGQASNVPVVEAVLMPGDVVLVQGRDEEIARLKDSGELLVLDATMDVPHTKKAPLAFGLMLLIVVLAATKTLPVSVAALAGVVLMLATGCMKLREALRALDASMIFLTVASIALSVGLMKTGGAKYVAEVFVALSSGLAPFWILSGLVLMMAVFANIISNTSAAVIGTPIAVSIANLLGVSPEPFVLAVLFGVNLGFCTPMADNCNLLVLNPGGYRFMDYTRVGVPLTILMWIAITIVLPMFFPFET